MFRIAYPNIKVKLIIWIGMSIIPVLFSPWFSLFSIVFISVKVSQIVDAHNKEIFFLKTKAEVSSEYSKELASRVLELEDSIASGGNIKVRIVEKVVDVTMPPSVNDSVIAHLSNYVTSSAHKGGIEEIRSVITVIDKLKEIQKETSGAVRYNTIRYQPDGENENTGEPKGV